VAAVRVLVDTDVLIDYFNAGEYAALLDDRRNRIYYSVVTRKELLAFVPSPKDTRRSDGRHPLLHRKTR